MYFCKYSTNFLKYLSIEYKLKHLIKMFQTKCEFTVVLFFQVGLLFEFWGSEGVQLSVQLVD